MAAAATAHKTLSDAIKEDHLEVRSSLELLLKCCLTLNILKMYEYYDQYVRASGNKDAQERWANQLTWEIARHAVGEEIVVYPLMEKHLGQKGVELANQDRADHQVGLQFLAKGSRMTYVSSQFAKENLYKLESLTPGTTEHASLLKEIMDHLHKHNDSEEKEDLPRLEPVLGEEGSIEAALSFSRTKHFAPTR